MSLCMEHNLCDLYPCHILKTNPDNLPKTNIIIKYLVVVSPLFSFVQCGEDEVVWEKLPKCANSLRDWPGLEKICNFFLLIVNEGLTSIK